MRYPVLVPVGLALAACSSTREPERSLADSVPPGSLDSVQPRALRSRLPSGVSARVDLPKADVAVGEPVTIRLVLRNGGSHEEELAFVSGANQRIDVMVLDSAGREVWSRLYHQDIDLGRIVVRLRAGDSLVFTERWNQRDNEGRPVTPGTYTVQGHHSPRSDASSWRASAHLRVCRAERDC